MEELLLALDTARKEFTLTHMVFYLDYFENRPYNCYCDLLILDNVHHLFFHHVSKKLYHETCSFHNPFGEDHFDHHVQSIEKNWSCFLGNLKKVMNKNNLYVDMQSNSSKISLFALLSAQIPTSNFKNKRLQWDQYRAFVILCVYGVNSQLKKYNCFNEQFLVWTHNFA